MADAALHLPDRAPPPGPSRRRAGHRAGGGRPRHDHDPLDLRQHRHGGGRRGRLSALVPGLPAGRSRRAARAGRARRGEHGYEALVMTVDLQRLGRRERDIRVGFELPFDVSVPNVAIAAESSLDDAAESELRGERDLGGSRVARWLRPAGHREGRAASGRCAGGASSAAPPRSRSATTAAGSWTAAIASLDALPAVVEAVDGRGPVLLRRWRSARDRRADGAGAGRHRRRHRAPDPVGAGRRRRGRGSAGCWTSWPLSSST